MRVLCCGSRDYTDIDKIVSRMSLLPPQSTIIQGDAKGADLICKLVAKSLGFNIESYPAEWDKYGKRAGMIRNKTMIMSDIDLVLAFRTSVKSRGTNNTILLASQHDIETEIID